MVGILEQIENAIADLDMSKTDSLCQKALEIGIDPYRIVNAMSKGMEEVGKRYESGDYFLSELIAASEILRQGMKIIEPHLSMGESPSGGRVLIGTVRGDVHDIGKNLVSTLLKSAGFAVKDLGNDVSPNKFIAETKEFKPDILALSALLSTTMPEMKIVIEGLEKEKIRTGPKVIIGGAPVTKGFADRIGADAASIDAVEGVSICRIWMKEKQT